MKSFCILNGKGLIINKLFSFDDCGLFVYNVDMKYPISKEFGLYARFNPPINGFMLRFARVALSSARKRLFSSKQLNVQTVKITCRDGKIIKCYVVRPQGRMNERQPIIFDIHGGGFVLKAAPYHYDLAKIYAAETNCAVVFPDYRLAYNTPFLTPLNDCIDMYGYILDNAEALNLDTSNITLVGDSAGGYLALALAKHLSEVGQTTPKAAMLVYPVADPTMSTQSMQQYTDTPMCNAISIRKMWRYYTNGKNDVYNPLTDDLSFMPPTYVETTEFDCLRDEGIALYNQLCKCGVSVKLHQTVGTMHGFDICLRATTTQNAIAQRTEFLKNLLDR